MSNPITSVTVTQQIAPAPPTLQRSGAFLSQGATNTSPGTYSLLKQQSDLTPLLKGALALTSITWSGSVATATATAPHGLTVSDVIEITISGEAPSGYNGTFNCTITGASTFTYPLASNPGMQSVAGVYTLEDVAELTAMANTFFAQGAGQAVWVLELGAGNATDGTAFLTAWITANPRVFYAYLVPRYWDGNAAFLAMVAQFEALTSKTYFFTTTTLATWQSYTPLMKSVLAMIEAPSYGIWPANVLTAISYSGGIVTGSTTSNHGVLPGQYFKIAGCTPAGYNGTFQALLGTTGETLVYALGTDPGMETILGTLVQSQYASTGIPATEFSLASVFQNVLKENPGSGSRVPPLNQAFLSGVTPFPTQGNSAIISTLNTAGINLVGTGAAGGIAAAVLIGGMTMDAKPFNYWYTVDWVTINVPLDINAELINARNSDNPIYFNQDGIKSVQQQAISTMSTGLSAGLVLNPIKATTLDAADFLEGLDDDDFSGFTVINAQPFSAYVNANPNDYPAGIYNGLAINFTPLRGFDSITVAIDVSNFAT